LIRGTSPSLCGPRPRPAKAPQSPVTSGRRVPESAHEQLVLVARTSESQQNRKGYEAFLALGDDTRRALVASILVADGSAAIDTIDEELRRLVWAGANPSRQDAFVRRLREWWYGRVRAHLLGQDNHPL
jgi:hypothetical protein